MSELALARECRRFASVCAARAAKLRSADGDSSVAHAGRQRTIQVRQRARRAQTFSRSFCDTRVSKKRERNLQRRTRRTQGLHLCFFLCFEKYIALFIYKKVGLRCFNYMIKKSLNQQSPTITLLTHYFSKHIF